MRSSKIYLYLSLVLDGQLMSPFSMRHTSTHLNEEALEADSLWLCSRLCTIGITPLPCIIALVFTSQSAKAKEESDDTVTVIDEHRSRHDGV